MADFFRLSPPQPTPSGQSRPHLFPLRSLGAADFDRLARYRDTRLAALLAGRPAGIVTGLRIGAQPGSDSVIVRPGLGIAGDGRTLALRTPMRVAWSELIGAQHGDGVYLICLAQRLRRDARDVSVPCRRGELDPLRDLRADTESFLTLRGPLAGYAPEPLDGDAVRIANRLAARFVEALPRATIGDGLALGLVAVQAGAPLWVDTDAARFAAVPDAARRALLEHTLAAIARGRFASLETAPAAAPLPRAWLSLPAPDGTLPVCANLPAHLHLTLLPVRASEFPPALAAAQARGLLQLGDGRADHVHLLLAIPDADYRPDLLSIPTPDMPTLDALYRAWLATQRAWAAARDARERLWRASDDDRASLGDDVLAALLPDPDPVEPAAPTEPAALLAALAQRLAAESLSAPPGYANFAAWSAGHAGDGAPAAVAFTGSGARIRLARAATRLVQLQRSLAARTDRLDGIRDFLGRLRQQLDAHTGSLAALSGGVASDGSGLRIARWLPYVSLTAPATTIAAADAPLAGARTLSVELPLANAAPIADIAVRPSFTTTLFDVAGVQSAGVQQRFDRVLASGGGLNQQIRDTLAQIPRSAEPATPAAFQAQSADFGVIRHVLPEVYALQDAGNDLAMLRDEINERLFPDRPPPNTDQPSPRLDSTAIRRLFLDVPAAQRYPRLVELGRHLHADATLLERLRTRMETAIRLRLQEIERQKALIARLQAGIVALETALAASRVELDDTARSYAMAQALTVDDWAGVAAARRERRRVLNAARGFGYVRALPWTIPQAPAPAVALAAGDGDELVPGLTQAAAEALPEALAEFAEALFEVPVAEWRSLRGLLADLPVRRVLDEAVVLRAQRLGLRSRRTTSFGPRYAALERANRALYAQAAVVLPIDAAASLQRQRERAAQQYSLDDALHAPPGRLRTAAMALHARLEPALRAAAYWSRRLPAPLKLELADRADEGALDTAHPERWPAPPAGSPETVLADWQRWQALLRWLNAQLPEPAPTGRAALDHLLRALLLAAAHGDLALATGGRVAAGATLRPGQTLRLTLERELRPGTRLELRDGSQRLVGRLQLDDIDAQGLASARVVEALTPGLTVTTAFRVSTGAA